MDHPRDFDTASAAEIAALRRRVAELEAAEERRLGAERQLHATFDQAAVGIAEVAIEGTWLRVNDRLCDILGYARSELLQTRFQEITHPGDHEADRRCASEMLAGKAATYSIEKRYIRKDGSVVWVHLAVGLARDEEGNPDYFIAVIEDITERRRAEEEVRRFFDLPVHFVVVCGFDGVFRRINRTWTEVFGYQEEELVSQPFLAFVHPDDQQKTLDELKNLQHGESTLFFENRHRCKDGSYRWLAWTAIPYPEEDLVYAMAYDVTERRQHEEAREVLEKQLRQAQKMEAIGQLAGGIAHDFNNTLQSLMGCSQFLLDQLTPETEQYGFAEEICQGTERAAALTRQLLAFSRRQILDPKILDINEVIENLLRMLRRTIREHIELVFVPAGQIGAIFADPGQVEQVLINLCVNARDAMPEGGRLVIETDEVRLDDAYCALHAWAKPGAYAVMSVSDNGAGMDEVTRQQVFEPFFTTKEVGKGTGLGLSTVYGIVRQHDGIVHVYSEPGQGATFRIYLPLSEGQAESRVSTRRDTARGGAETVLLVEDDNVVRQLSARILKTAGYGVIEANDGEEAIAILEAEYQRIDLAILDVVMPKCGGREVSERFLALRPSARVLFMSGYTANVFHTEYVLESGLAFIQKPYSHGALLRKVREVLDTE